MERLEVMLRNQARALAKECTGPTAVYVAILTLFVLGAFLFKDTGIHAIAGGTEYEGIRRRRFAGITLMALAVICAGLKVFSQSEAPSRDLPPAVLEKAQPTTAQGKPSPYPDSQPASNAASSYFPYATANPALPQAAPVETPLREANELLKQRLLDSALDKVNEAIRAAPQNPDAYCLRGSINARKMLWDDAEKDYQTVLQLDSKNIQVKFDMAELQFMQKKYVEARPGFDALKQNSDFGDLAAYKVFLCDLFGGHEETAAAELEAFNQAGTNASYPFANAAWCLYQHKTEEARTWLTSAAKIYEPYKLGVYASSLNDLGYLPLPPPAPEQAKSGSP